MDKNTLSILQPDAIRQYGKTKVKFYFNTDQKAPTYTDIIVDCLKQNLGITK